MMERKISVIGERMRLKDRILEGASKIIKLIQEHHSRTCVDESLLHLSNDDRLLQRLCEHLDHAFLHGLRHITNGYWQVAQEFTRKEAVREIKNLTKIITDLGRGRAWLYLALNENLLECYIRCFLENPRVMKKYYVSEALLLDAERLDVLLTITAGLEFVTFDLDLDVAYLDLATFIPKWRSTSSNAIEDQDSDDHYSMSSIDSEASGRSRGSSQAECAGPSLPRTNSSLDTSLLCIDDCELLGTSVMESEIENRLSSLEINPDDSVVPIEVFHAKKRKPRGKSRSSSASPGQTPPDQTPPGQTPPGASNDLNANSSQQNDAAVERALDNVNGGGQCCDHAEKFAEHFDAKIDGLVCDNCRGAIDVGDHSGVVGDNQNYAQDEATQFSLSSIEDGHDRVSLHSNRSSEHELVETLVPAFMESGTFDFYHESHHDVSQLMDNAVDGVGAVAEATTQSSSVVNIVDECELGRDSPYVDIFCIDGQVHSREIPRVQVSCPSVSGSAAESDVSMTQAWREEGDGASETSNDEATPVHEPIRTPVTSTNSNVLHTSQERCMDVSVDNNMMLYLLLDVFHSQNERLQKVYLTYLGFTDGTLQVAYVILSDTALYILTRQPDDSNYKREAKVDYRDIDYVSLSLSYQVITIVCLNRRNQYLITTGDSQLTKCMMNDMDTIIKQCTEFSIPRLSVLTDATTQKIGMRKWVARECRCLASEVELVSYTLVQWEDLGMLTDSRPLTMEGDLMYKSVGPTSSSQWMVNRFVLRDGILYRYVNGVDNVKPEVCVDLNGDDCRGCRRCPISDRENTFELLLANRRSIWLSTACPVETESWLRKLFDAVADKSSITSLFSSCLPCCAVVTSQKLLLCHEDVQTNFFRTLASANVDDVTGVCVDTMQAPTFCVLEFESREVNVSSDRWILYFTSPHENKQFIDSLSEVWMRFFKVSLPVARLGNTPLRRRCQEMVAKTLSIRRQFTQLGNGPAVL